MPWSQSVSTSKFSLGRHSPSVPKKTQATFLGPEFRVPFHLVKNQVEVFRCEAHISLLGMLISGWAAISIFESSWGGASKSCLALKKRRRNWALTSIFWPALSVFLCFFFFSPICSSFFHPFIFFSFSCPVSPVLLPPSLLFFSIPLLTLPSSFAYLSLPCFSLPSLIFAFCIFVFGKNKQGTRHHERNTKLARDPTGRGNNIFYLLIFIRGVVAGSYALSVQKNFPQPLELHVCIQ